MIPHEYIEELTRRTDIVELVGYLLLAFSGGMFIEKSKGSPVISAVGLVLGDAACYVLGTVKNGDHRESLPC